MCSLPGHGFALENRLAYLVTDPNVLGRVRNGFAAVCEPVSGLRAPRRRGTSSKPGLVGWIVRTFVAASLLVSCEVALADAVSVAALLRERCVVCHRGETAPLGLRLDSLEALMAGSRDGPVVIPGDPSGSELMARIEGASRPRMPMSGPPWLSRTQTALVREWIASGAPLGPAGPVDAASDTETGSEPPFGTVHDTPVTPTWSEIAPVLARGCARCHAPEGAMGPAPEGFMVTSLDAVLSAADRARVVPGNPAASELLRRIKGLSRPRMPFDGPPWLDDAEIALVESWIRAGAPDASGAAATVPRGAAVRFEGVLTSPDTVDDARFARAPGVRIDKAPRVGDRVELRARVVGEGALVAERLRKR